MTRPDKENNTKLNLVISMANNHRRCSHHRIFKLGNFHKLNFLKFANSVTYVVRQDESLYQTKFSHENDWLDSVKIITIYGQKKIFICKRLWNMTNSICFRQQAVYGPDLSRYAKRESSFITKSITPAQGRKGGQKDDQGKILLSARNDNLPTDGNG